MVYINMKDTHAFNEGCTHAFSLIILALLFDSTWPNPFAKRFRQFVTCHDNLQGQWVYDRL